jgi:hypothetical protein
MPRLQGHIVICNWSDRSADLVRAIHSDMFIKYENQTDWRPVVVVAEGVDRFPDENAFQGTMLLPGSPLDTRMLERANIRDAHAVVIMADFEAPDPDDRSVMIAINANAVIHDPSGQKHDKTLDPARIIVETIDPARAQILRSQKHSLVDEVVCQSDLNIRVVAQSNISRGLTFILRELLDFSEDSDEFYMIKVPEDWAGLAFAKQGFFDLVRWIGRHSRDAGAGHDEPLTILVGFVRPGDDERKMIINPKEPEYAKEGPVKAGDYLILIARTREVAKQVCGYGGDLGDVNPLEMEAKG